MPAVVFGPDRAIRRSHPRIGLVLGAAWMTGALAGLQDRLPAAADVDLIVGTSAGSVLAAALRCRASMDEIVAWQCGDATGVLSESVVLAAKDGPLPPLPHLRPGSLPLARAALFLQVPPWVGASGWLPHGRGQHAALRSLVSALHWRHSQNAGRSGTWVPGDTWIAANRQVGRGYGREVIGGDTDGVDDLLIRADLVELRQTQAAPIFQLVGSCGAGCFAGGAGTNQSSEVEILDSAGEHIAGRGATTVDECDHGQV